MNRLTEGEGKAGRIGDSTWPVINFSKLLLHTPQFSLKSVPILQMGTLRPTCDHQWAWTVEEEQEPWS